MSQASAVTLIYVNQLNIQMPPARRVTLILTVTLNIQMPPVRAVTLLNSFADVVILVKVVTYNSGSGWHLSSPCYKCRMVNDDFYVNLVCN